MMNQKIICSLFCLLAIIFLPNISLSAQCDLDCDDGCAETIDSLNPETCECEYIVPECDQECLYIKEFNAEECECEVILVYDIFCEYPEIFDYEECGCIYCPILPSFSVECVVPNSYIVNFEIEGVPNENYGIVSPMGDTIEITADDTGIALYTTDAIFIPPTPVVNRYNIYTDDCSINTFPSALNCICNEYPNTGLYRDGALYGVSGFPEGEDLTYTWYNAATNEEVAQFVNHPYYSPSEVGEYYLIVTNPNEPDCAEILGPRTIETLDGCCELESMEDGN